MRRTEEGWAAVCGDGEEYASESLVEAIRDAVGHERGESLTLGAGTHRSMEQWVLEQAARIERESAAP